MNLLLIACLMLLPSASGLDAISGSTYQETEVDLSVDASKYVYAFDDHKNQFSCARSCKAESGCSGFGFRDNPGGENCILFTSDNARAKLPASTVGFKYYTMTRGDPSSYYNHTWIVIQRRINGQVSFDRSWQEYKDGFGDPAGEFWLGNDKLHQLTKDGDYMLRIVLVDDTGKTLSVEYNTFIVEDESANYRLTIGDFQGSSPPGDSMSRHSGMMFTTYDRDHDTSLDTINSNCAQVYKGGWWYHRCHIANLNGKYGLTRSGGGINWFKWRGHENSLSAAMMMVKRK